MEEISTADVCLEEGIVVSNGNTNTVTEIAIRMGMNIQSSLYEEKSELEMYYNS